MTNIDILNIVKENNGYTRKMSYIKEKFEFDQFKTFFCKFFYDESEMIETILKKCKFVVIKQVGQDVLFNELIIRYPKKGEPGYNDDDVYIVEIKFLYNKE